VLLVLLVFPYEILSIIYGVSYAVGSTSLILYSLGLFVSVYASPIYCVLTGMKRLDIIVKVILLNVVVNTILNWFLIPIYGINGAAFSSAFSNILMTALFFLAKDMTYLKVPRDIYKPLLAGFLALLAIYAIKPMLVDLLYALPHASTSESLFTDIFRKLSKAFVLGFLCLASACTYLMFLLLMKALHKDDVNIVTGGMRRLGVPERLVSFTGRILLRDE